MLEDCASGCCCREELAEERLALDEEAMEWLAGLGVFMMWLVNWNIWLCTKFCCDDEETPPADEEDDDNDDDEDEEEDSLLRISSSILSILYTYVNQSRVVDDKFWADDIGDDEDELTADVDGCCCIMFGFRFRFKILDVVVVDEEGIDDVIK